LGVTEGVGSYFHVLCSLTRFGRYRGRQVLFSFFALPNSSRAVPWASDTVFKFCAPRLIFRRYRGRRGSFSSFCGTGHFLGGIEVIGARILVLRSRTRFLRYRGRHGSFSCFALPDQFWEVPRPSWLVFKFFAPGHFFGGTEGIGYRIQLLRSHTRFRRYRGRRGSFSCFVLPDSFWAVPKPSGLVFKFYAPDTFLAVPRASGLVFMFCTPGQDFGRYRGLQVMFSCFALPNPFWAVPRAPGLVFMFCAPGHIFGGGEGVGSRFHVLRSQTLFGRFRGRRVLFSFFALQDPLRAVPRVSCTVFKFCATGLVFDGTEGVRARFHVLLYQTLFVRYRDRRGSFPSFALPDTLLAVPRELGPVFMFWLPDSFSTIPRPSGLDFMFCAPGLFLGVTEGVGFRFHVLCSRTSFGRYRGRQVSFSSFSLPDSFSTVPKASGLVFIFCAPALILGGTTGVGYRFQFLRSRTRFQWYRGHRGTFSCFEVQDSFWAVPRPSGLVLKFALPDTFLEVPRASGLVFKFCAPGHVFVGTKGVGYRGCRVPFSSFALLDSFLTVSRAYGLVVIFCAPVRFLGITEGTASRFHVLCSQTRFERYRGRRVTFSCFALPDSFWALPRVSGPVFMFCAPGLVSGGTDGAGSRFHVLRSRTRFRRNRGCRGSFSYFALSDSFPTTEGVGARFHVLRSRRRFWALPRA
jgi:hypothetical protein